MGFNKKECHAEFLQIARKKRILFDRFKIGFNSKQTTVKKNSTKKNYINFTETINLRVGKLVWGIGEEWSQENKRSGWQAKRVHKNTTN